jgi:catechol 2,3-dioxygenase-like lactoylglutathione lyase family enzyme
MLVELHVPDFEKAKNFYKKLGFEIVYENKPTGFGGYLVMKMDNNILCFWPGTELVWKHPYFKRFSKETKRGYAVELVVMVKDIKKFYDKVKGFCNVVEELIQEPWGLWDFRIEDPFGFYIRFTEPHDILKP